jgi:hypothetical protein
MANREGFALTEVLMEVLSVTALVVMPALIGVQSSLAASGLSEARTDRHIETLRSELRALAEQQVLHYLDDGSFAQNPADLGVEPPQGVILSVDAGPHGWSATAAHEALDDRAGCVVFFGAVAPPSTPVRPDVPGAVACTE